MTGEEAKNKIKQGMYVLHGSDRGYVAEVIENENGSQGSYARIQWQGRSTTIHSFRSNEDWKEIKIENPFHYEYAALKKGTPMGVDGNALTSAEDILVHLMYVINNNSQFTSDGRDVVTLRPRQIAALNKAVKKFVNQE